MMFRYLLIPCAEFANADFPDLENIDIFSQIYEHLAMHEEIQTNVTIMFEGIFKIPATELKLKVIPF